VEHIEPLDLPAPDPADAAGFYANPSVKLFLERAAEASPSFRSQDLDAHHRTAIVHIVRRLDGIPLAIELAAARTITVPVRELAQHLDESFALLTSASRTAHPRQQTIHAAVDWSYELLTDDERAAFVSCGVLCGTWSLEAAMKVCFDSRLSVVEMV